MARATAIGRGLSPFLCSLLPGSGSATLFDVFRPLAVLAVLLALARSLLILFGFVCHEFLL